MKELSKEILSEQDIAMQEHYKSLKTCICTEAPMGAGGLEGYNAKEKYKYQYLEKDRNGRPYYRVYHSYDYYETCGTTMFKSHFKTNEPLIDQPMQTESKQSIRYFLRISEIKSYNPINPERWLLIVNKKITKPTEIGVYESLIKHGAIPIEAYITSNEDFSESDRVMLPDGTLKRMTPTDYIDYLASESTATKKLIGLTSQAMITKLINGEYKNHHILTEDLETILNK